MSSFKIFKHYLAPNYNIEGTFCLQNYQSVSAENGFFASGSQSLVCQTN
jgi:hypothetical protein